MNIYNRMPELIHELAHTYCGGKWVAVGGGGYDIWKVVPRAWSLLWLEMSDHPLKKKLKNHPLTPLPDEWIRRWQPQAPVTLPSEWLDDLSRWEAIPRRDEITAKNRETLAVALQDMP
ncbi:Acetoin utilization protein AcuC [compost metagenome]